MITAEALSAYYCHLQSQLGGLKTKTVTKQYCQHIRKIMMLSFCGGHVRGLTEDKGGSRRWRTEQPQFK